MLSGSALGATATVMPVGNAHAQGSVPVRVEKWKGALFRLRNHQRARPRRALRDSVSLVPKPVVGVNTEAGDLSSEQPDPCHHSATEKRNGTEKGG